MYLFITFLLLHECVNAKYYEVKHSRSQKNILRNIFPNSGIDDALKQVAKAFPNYAIEIQIQGAQDDLPGRKMKHKNPMFRGNRRFYQNWPLQIGRFGEDPNFGKNIVHKDLKTHADSTTTTTTTTTMTTTTKQETLPTIRDLFPRQPTNGVKRPLYMEDLIKALEDFEKNRSTVVDHNDYTRWEDGIETKGISSTTDCADRPVVKKDLWELEKIISPRNCNTDREYGSNVPVLPHVDNRNMAVKNFHDVVRLIKKGVKVQLEVTTPRHRDSNLKWVPIKVPREMYKK